MVQKRIEERRAGLQRKREERLQMGDSQETIRFFNENFAKVKGGMSLIVVGITVDIVNGSFQLHPKPSSSQ